MNISLFFNGGFFMNINNKNKIGEVAFKLSIEYGFDNMTIKQIQDEANVSVGAVYYHFKDKNDILDYIIDIYIRNEIKKFKENIRNYKGSLPKKLKLLFYHYLGKDFEETNCSIRLLNNEMINHTEYTLFLLGIYHHYPDFRHYFHEFNMDMLNFYKEIVDDFKKNNEIRREIDTEDIAIQIFTTVSGFITLWGGFQPNLKLEKFMDANIQMICDYVEIKD